MQKAKFKPKINWKVILYSIIAIISLVLAYAVYWMFLGIAAVMILLNQRELFKN